MTLVIGIDGGGSTIRAAVVRDDLTILGDYTGGTANPSVIGREAAANLIQTAVRAAIQNAKVTADQIDSVSIGVAGASNEHSEQWLRDVLAPVLPSSHMVPSSDLEIALVGARGERRGVLLLAGTGSAAYGVNDAGESVLVGGWGYLLGDEGSGYWLGMQALIAVTHEADRGIASAFTRSLLSTLGLEQPRDLVGWLYRSASPRNREIAALAPIILQAAEANDSQAITMVDEAAVRLAALATTAAQRLHLETPSFAYAGGLLENENILSRQLCQRLNLTKFPQRLYPPVIGAALLALMHTRT